MHQILFNVIIKFFWLPFQVVPDGFLQILRWIKDEYDSPEIIVTENGFSDYGGVEDTGRINYLQVMSRHVFPCHQLIDYRCLTYIRPLSIDYKF